MATGIITTARGVALNIDELIQQAQRPAGTRDAASERETARFVPSTVTRPTVRGFVPAAGAAASSRSVPGNAATASKPVTKKPGVTGTALADHTRVVISQNGKGKKKVISPETTTAEDGDEVLGDIIGRL